MSVDTAYAARSKNRVKTKGKMPAVAAISSAASKKRVIPKIPPFPEKAPPVNWSKVDWDREIVLEKDKEEYYNEINRLEAQNKSDEAMKLKLNTHRMSDDEVLQYYNIPLGVREAVIKYRDAIKFVKGIKQKENYKKQLQLTLISQGFSGAANAVRQQDAQKNQIIDVSKATLLKNLKLINAGKPIPPRVKAIKQTKLQPKQQRFFDVTFEGLIRKSRTARTKKFGSALYNVLGKTFAAIKGFFIDTAYADDAISPFIEYYDGIEKNAVDAALYYLSQNQNSDGSFGNFNKYELTAQIVFMTAEFNLTDKGQFNAAINYLTTAAPQNNREKALKARVMLGLGQPYQQLLDEIVVTKNADGGYGLEQNYLSDPQTTMEVAFAFYAADFGTETHFLQALAFVLNNIKADGSMYYTKNGGHSLYLAGKTAEYLKPFQDFTIGDAQNKVTVQSKIDSLLGFLTSNYETADDVIDQTLIARAFQLYDKEKGKQADLREKITQSQFSNGNFGTSLYATIAAMRALAGAEIEMTDLTNIGSLINKQTAQFQLTVKNKGYRPINKGIIYLFADNVNLNFPIDLAANNIEIAPQSSVNVTVTFDDTIRFLGSTEMKFFIESADSEVLYADNWIAKNFTFAPASDSSPALPMYYIAQQYGIEGAAGLNVRWKFKNDPNRSGYIILWREKNTNQWYGYNIDNTSSGAFLSGSFIEEIVYEVNVGVVDKNGYITPFAYATEVKATAGDLKYTSAFNGYVTIDNKPTSDIYVSALYGNSNVSTMSSGENGIIGNDKMPNGSNALKVSNQQYEPIITILTTPTAQTTSDVRVFSRLIPDTTPPVINNIAIKPSVDFKVKNQQEVLLWAAGSDNIALKEADFYYFNPAENAWIFLGTENMQNSNSGEAEMPWYIPETMLGTGYKLKAIFTDFSGNQSAPKEWGPFEIIDGVPPSGSIIVEGLINNQWALGEKKTIAWNIKSIKQISGIALKYGNGLFTLPSSNSYDIAKNTFEYTLQLDSSFVANNATVRITVADENWNWAVIESQPFDIVDKTPPPQAPWNTPQIFEGMTANYGEERYLIDAFHNTDGSMEIIYKEFLGNAALTENRRLVYRKLINGQWQNPLLLAEYNFINGQTPDVSFYEIQAIKAKNGDVHLVYQRYGGGDAIQKDATEIYYTHISNGQLIINKQISNNQTFSRFPNMAISGNGIVSIAWIDGFSAVNQSGLSTLRYVEGDGYQSWSQESTLTDDNTEGPALAVDGNSIVIAYVYKEQFYIVKKTGGNWSNPVVINKPDIPKNQLANSAYLLSLFVNNNNVYDIFYVGMGKITKYDIYNIRASIDAVTGTSNIQNYSLLSDLLSTGYVLNYRIVKNNDDNYQIFYTQQKYLKDGYSQYRAFHLLFDGVNTYFKTHTSMPTMDVDKYIIAGTEQNDFLMTFFKGAIAGSYQTFYNIADYSGIINYKIDPVSPLDGASNITKQDNLKWGVAGGIIDSFDVFFGTDPYYLTQIASGITGTSFSMPTLNPQTTYYWQIVGHAKNKLIYSNMWSFSTKEITQPINVEIKAMPNIGVAPLKVQFDAVVSGGDPANYIYLWDVNNDGKMDYTIKNPVHTYTPAGTYTAVLTVFDGVDTVVKNIAVTILNPLTVKTKAEPSIGFVPLKVQFDALATGGYSANYTYSWDVNNDGIVDYTIKNPMSTYTVVGITTAVLKVSDGADTVTKNITITVQPQGDLNNDGVVNNADVECTTSIVLWTMGDKSKPLPSCLKSGSISDSDLNCDKTVNVADVNMAVMLFQVSQKPLPKEIDANQNKIHDKCEAK